MGDAPYMKAFGAHLPGGHAAWMPMGKGHAMPAVEPRELEERPVCGRALWWGGELARTRGSGQGFRLGPETASGLPFHRQLLKYAACDANGARRQQNYLENVQKKRQKVPVFSIHYSAINLEKICSSPSLKSFARKCTLAGVQNMSRYGGRCFTAGQSQKVRL